MKVGGKKLQLAEKPGKGRAEPAAARKAAEKKVRSVIDGRLLRATGRTAQINVRVRPSTKSGSLPSIS